MAGTIARLVSSSTTMLAASLLGTVVTVASPLESTAATASPVTCAASTTHVGRIAGIARPAADGSASRCGVRSLVSGEPPTTTSSGAPPFVYGGGPLMDTTSTLTIQPVLWDPSGYLYQTPGAANTYVAIVERYLRDVAAASGTSGDDLSVLRQYYDVVAGVTHYVSGRFVAGTPLVVTTPYPSAATSAGCAPDDGAVYANGQGDTTCVTDVAIAAEGHHLASTQHLATGMHTLFVILLPRRVEECITGQNLAHGGVCDAGVNPTKTTVDRMYCGYHTDDQNAIYAVEPFPVVDGAGGLTCSSSKSTLGTAKTPIGNESPNGNIDADTEVSIVTHEIAEAVTDPLPSASGVAVSGQTGWIDKGSEEIGDDCAYVYGDSLQMLGAPGHKYNQSINGDHYFVQGLFSQAEDDVNPTFACAVNAEQSVLLDPTGGTGQMDPEVAPSGASLTLSPATFLRAGYQFGGWNTAADGSGTAVADGGTLSALDETLYAQWYVGSTYEVTFDSNVNPVDADNVRTTQSSNSPVDLAASSFTNGDLVLASWNTAADGSGTRYAPGALYGFRADLTLYAQWRAPLPGAPQDLSVTRSTNALSLRWAAPATVAGATVSGYLVRVGTSAGAANVANEGTAQSPLTALTYRVSGLENGSTYFVEILAVGPGGVSTSGDSSTVTTAAAHTRVTLTASHSALLATREASEVFTTRVVATDSSDTPAGSVLIERQVSSTWRPLCHARLDAEGVATCRLRAGQVPVGRAHFRGDFVATAHDDASVSAVVSVTVS